jgi:hypothetical protein
MSTKDIHEHHEPAPPLGLGSSEGLGPEVDAGHVGPGPALYEVTYTHGHKTLKAGELVRMVEDPRCNNLLLRTDWTLHLLADEHNQYVHLRLVLMEARAEPQVDRPAGSGLTPC